MSAISDIYDALESVADSALSATHSELLNPYVPEDDSNLNMSAAWGITIADHNELTADVNQGGAKQYEQIFELVLTRRIFATKSDRSTRKTTEKQLLEDLKLFTDKLIQDRTLSGTCQYAYYQSHGGLIFIRDNRVGIIALRASVSAVYDEEVILCP